MDVESFHRLMRFVLDLRREGITDARVLGAMERTDRGMFAPAQFTAFAFQDKALPIDGGQKMTKPSDVARMVSHLEVGPEDVILEVGSGTGYQAAVLAALGKRVTSLERRARLAGGARERLGALRIMNAYLHTADGLDGWEDGAPYDRIILNGAVTEPPAPLLDQLTPNGVLVCVSRTPGKIIRYARTEQGVAVRECEPIQLPPLEPGLSFD